MLVTIKDPIGKILCRVTVQPLSPVRELLSKAIAETSAIDLEEGLFLRPCTWAESVGLHPDTKLPLVLNEYILDSLQRHPQLIEYEPALNRTTRESNLFACSFAMRHNSVALVYWGLIVCFALKLILF